MTVGNSPSTSGELFIGRQPILDREQASIGFELQFRRTQTATANATAATAEMVRVIQTREVRRSWLAGTVGSVPGWVYVIWGPVQMVAAGAGSNPSNRPRVGTAAAIADRTRRRPGNESFVFEFII